MEAYFASGLITQGVQIVDARHSPTVDDQTMIRWFRDTGCPVTVVANKLDKLKKSEIEPSLQRIRQVLELEERIAVIPFSAQNRVGVEALRQVLFGQSGVHS